MKHFISLSSILILTSCSGLIKKDTKVEHYLEPPNIRIDQYKDTWNLKGKGPVKLPCGTSCKASELDKYKPEEAAKFSKQGTWEEYIEKEKTGGIKYSVLDKRGEYVDGKREGLWKSFYEVADGQTAPVLRETPYKNGKKDGIEKKYKEDGLQIEETTYVDGLMEGPYWQKTRKGLWKLKGRYSNDLEEGKWIEYYAEDADLVINNIAHYRAGKKHGAYISYFKDGKTVQAQGDYTSDAGGYWKVGKWNFYYESGQLQSSGVYDTQPATDDSGKVKVNPTTNTIISKRIGVWKKFYMNGDIFFEGALEGNRPNGEWRFYFKGGKLCAFGTMANEFMMKEGTVYNEDGSLWGKGVFMTSLIKMNEKEDKIETKFTPGYPFTYYKNGQKYMEITDEKDDSGKVVAREYSNSGSVIGKGPIQPLIRKKDGCWEESGKKVLYRMGSVVTSKIQKKMFKCE
ncbi:MAG: LIC20035 family adhesin [Leptospiraceae bacterium]|nr:LIC20035 family adhesin [Leptospiraceae bacterium]MCP5502330.1 LIC20035 family adhesin [Leptospiraceae bacterium]